MTDREARDAAVSVARAYLKTETLITPIVEKAIEEENTLLDERDEDDDSCSVCGIELRWAGSHYHCGACGKESSMMGHYTKYADGGWDFSCKTENVNRER